jgi:5-methylcytosine-specific restriction endonuclease McrA
MHGSLRGKSRRAHEVRLDRAFFKMQRDESYSALRGKCGYCESPLPRGAATADHITPLHKNGSTSRDNIIAACTSCNWVKGSMSAGKFRNILNSKTPPPIDGHWSLELAKAWIRFRINKRLKKAEKRIKLAVGMEF